MCPQTIRHQTKYFDCIAGLFQTKAAAVANTRQGWPWITGEYWSTHLKYVACKSSIGRSKHCDLAGGGIEGTTPNLCPVSNFTHVALGKEQAHWSWCQELYHASYNRGAYAAKSSFDTKT